MKVLVLHSCGHSSKQTVFLPEGKNVAFYLSDGPCPDCVEPDIDQYGPPEEAEYGRLFVHAGVIPGRPLEEHDKHTLIWDRDLYCRAVRYWRGVGSGTINVPWDEVYIGHTDLDGTSGTPIEGGGVWCMDTGAGWKGRLSVMDVDSKQVWQSDPVPTLYEEEGR